ncbi:D-arabinono-1,4-lactone oxidase [Georgenia sp. MJ206]|uniref:D-arabinono-1,4-lactone oxidase n=1 Tax=Georgenia wangjunii TaxID=3117730 RepID=UPI002F262600
MANDMMSNWAGNHEYAGALVRPASLEEAAEVVARSRRVRAVGSRHSFNDIVDSEETLVSLDRLAYRHPGLLGADESDAEAGRGGPDEDAGSAARDGDRPAGGADAAPRASAHDASTPNASAHGAPDGRPGGLRDRSEDDALPGGPEPELDPLTGRVRVSAATRYADLARYLEGHGRTLPNFASLPHIGIAGAIATATHGSGTENPVLASSVVALELITADGTARTIDRDTDGDALHGATVSLGALGLVHAVTLETVPAFDVVQTVHGPVAFADLADAFDDVSALAYSVSCFTTLRSPEFETVWLKRVHDPRRPGDDGGKVLGAPAKPVEVHPIPGIDPENATAQRAVPGPAADRLPHFRADHLPSAGAEIQCEYLVPRQNARLALRALAGLAEPLAGLVQVCEVRSIAADLAWMSPMYNQPCVGIHFTLVRDVERVGAVLPLLEEAFGALAGRPHWGKVFDADPDRVRALYPRRADFLDLLRTYDPERTFTNAFVRRWVG